MVPLLLYSAPQNIGRKPQSSLNVSPAIEHLLAESDQSLRTPEPRSAEALGALTPTKMAFLAAIPDNPDQVVSTRPLAVVS